MQKARLGCACPLIEVAWVLVQEGGQHGIANKDIGVAAGKSRAKRLTITFGAFAVSGLAAT